MQLHCTTRLVSTARKEPKRLEKRIMHEKAMRGEEDPLHEEL